MKKYYTGGRAKITRYNRKRGRSPYIRTNDGADTSGDGFTTYKNIRTGWTKTWNSGFGRGFWSK
jgi:hypothetical protein